MHSHVLGPTATVILYSKTVVYNKTVIFNGTVIYNRTVTSSKSSSSSKLALELGAGGAVALLVVSILFVLGVVYYRRYICKSV